MGKAVNISQIARVYTCIFNPFCHSRVPHYIPLWNLVYVFCHLPHPPVGYLLFHIGGLSKLLGGGERSNSLSSNSDQSSCVIITHVPYKTNVYIHVELAVILYWLIMIVNVFCEFNHNHCDY